MSVNVLGCGIMGQQIAGLLAAGGFDVHVYARSELSEATLARKVKLVQRQLGLKDRPVGAMRVVHSIDELPDSLTIESITEDLGAKQSLYREFRKSHKPARNCRRRTRSAFFNPIGMRLVELHLSAPERDATLERLLQFFGDSEFVIVNVEDNRGYIGNYLLFTAIANMLKLLERFKYSFAEIEKVYAKLFPGQDLVAIIDIVGVDTTLHIIHNLRQHDDSIYLPQTLLAAHEQNILGKKNGTTFRSLLL